MTASGVWITGVSFAGVSTSALAALTLAVVAATSLGGLSREAELASLSPIPVPGSLGLFIETLRRPIFEWHALRKQAFFTQSLLRYVTTTAAEFLFFEETGKY